MDIEGAEQRLFNPENEQIFKHAVRHLVAELTRRKARTFPAWLPTCSISALACASVPVAAAHALLEAVNNRRWAEVE